MLHEFDHENPLLVVAAAAKIVLILPTALKKTLQDGFMLPMWRLFAKFEGIQEVSLRVGKSLQYSK